MLKKKLNYWYAYVEIHFNPWFIFQTGGGLFEPPSGKIVITPTPKEL